MNRVISVFIHMIQSLDVSVRVFVTFLAAIIATCLVLFVFFPLFLALLKLILSLLQKILLAITNFCMRKWGKLVIRSRRKTGKFPQTLVNIEDFFVRVATSVSKFFERIILWKPPYGAISVRIVLVSCILLVLLTAALWVIPASNRALTAFQLSWEKEYITGVDQPVAVIMNREPQVYYTLAVESANFRKSPDGEVLTKLNESGLLLRYLGETKGQWLNVEYFEGSRKVQGWIHETMVTRWDTTKNPLKYLKPGDKLRMSASEIPIFTCELLGFEQTGDGTVHIILKE
ncbi:MAG: hypothetical protein KBA53_05065 [Thermoclostridium sp.]|nr:hypothetical protein [Thermoclostridium sp.]